MKIHGTFGTIMEVLSKNIEFFFSYRKLPLHNLDFLPKIGLSFLKTDKKQPCKRRNNTIC